MNLHQDATEIRGQVNTFGISGLILYLCQEEGGFSRPEDISFDFIRHQYTLKSD